MRALNKAATIEKMKAGFTLCRSSTIRGGPRAWLQIKPGCGGDSFAVHMSAFHSLHSNKEIEVIGDPQPWAHRVEYRLVPSAGVIPND